MHMYFSVCNSWDIHRLVISTSDLWIYPRHRIAPWWLQTQWSSSPELRGPPSLSSQRLHAPDSRTASWGTIWKRTSSYLWEGQNSKWCKEVVLMDMATASGKLRRWMYLIKAPSISYMRRAVTPYLLDLLNAMFFQVAISLDVWIKLFGSHPAACSRTQLVCSCLMPCTHWLRTSSCLQDWKLIEMETAQLGTRGSWVPLWNQSVGCSGSNHTSSDFIIPNQWNMTGINKFGCSSTVLSAGSAQVSEPSHPADPIRRSACLFKNLTLRWCLTNHRRPCNGQACRKYNIVAATTWCFLKS